MFTASTLASTLEHPIRTFPNRNLIIFQIHSLSIINAADVLVLHTCNFLSEDHQSLFSSFSALQMLQTVTHYTELARRDFSTYPCRVRVVDQRKEILRRLCHSKVCFVTISLRACSPDRQGGITISTVCLSKFKCSSRF